MKPLTGMLGAAALGNLMLGGPALWVMAAPRRTVHIRSLLSASYPRSILSKDGAVTSSVGPSSMTGRMR